MHRQRPRGFLPVLRGRTDLPASGRHGLVHRRRSVLGKVHVVEPGDHLPKIAAAEGFGNVDAIWDHPRNAELKATRKDVCILNPGDEIFIPDKEPKTVSVSTGEAYRFVILRPKIRLSLVIKDIANQPLANVPCELRTESASFRLVLDGNGKLDQEIPLDSESCQLILEDREIRLRVGHLVPIELPDGMRARLNNLGYEAGSPEERDETFDDPALRSAIEEFQCDNGLKVTGIYDAATQAKLLKVHGC
jgi:hypothetical protein